MTGVPFYKLQSIGNDFVLFDREVFGTDQRAEADLSQVAIAVCDRRFGVGADGMLTVERGSTPIVRMFNPDGTEDFCGNGLRCAAHWAAHQGMIGTRAELCHGGQVIEIKMLEQGLIESRLPAATYEPSLVPLRSGEAEWFDRLLEVGGHSYSADVLNTGSTHTVLHVDELPGDALFNIFGPAIEHNVRFPMRTSVIWCVTDARGALQVRIWERGVGETLGCGTGMTAAAVSTTRRLGSGGTYQVRSRGGELEIGLEKWDAPPRVRGTAQLVYKGYLPAALLFR